MRPGIVGHHHVALTVSDCAASADWYATVLGMVELLAEDGPTRRARVLGFAQGGYSVGLVEHADASPTQFSPTRVGLDHLAFTISDRATLDAWATHLTALSVPHSGVIDIPVGALLNFTDPDGIAIALFVDAASHAHDSERSSPPA